MTGFDRRLTPARPDLAAMHLKGDVEADRFVEAVPARVSVPVADLLPRPDAGTVRDTQLLSGEEVDVYERADGWAWVQACDDGYVGYLSDSAICDSVEGSPTHRVATLGTNLYHEPALKTPTTGALPFAARVAVLERRDGYCRIDDVNWVPDRHLARLDTPAKDWVAVAEMFHGVPYLWGGRSNLGLDCSALIQLARQAAGHRCPRDSYKQVEGEGVTLPDDAELRRGDLVFWRGHVGVMTDAETLLHSNGHHMATVREPLAIAIRRILDTENSPVTRRARYGDDPR